MRFSARYLSTFLLTLSLPTLLAAQSVTPQTNKTPRSSISGRVTVKDKGVGGVLVALRKNNEIQMPNDPVQKAITDPDGFYRITSVAPGNYEVFPTLPAFVPTERRDVRSKLVLVGDDDNVEGINFAMVRGGVITGRITDADGRPLIQQQVNIYQEGAFNQPQLPQRPSPPIFPVASVQTDDRGIYRAFGLQAGRYRVASGRSDDTMNTGASFGARSSYKQVFHPDVTEADKANVIEVSEGSEAADVDITLGRALQTFTATGRVVDGEKGLPIPNIRFSVQRLVGQRVEFVNSQTVSNVQGDFIIEGLLPGRYGVNLFQNQGNEMRAEALNFDIVDQDISGVVVKLAKGASLSGVVVIESEDKAVLAKLSEFQVRGFIVPQGGGFVSSSASSPVGPDGSFRLAGLGNGMVNFNIGTMNRPMPPKGFRIARLERDGVVVKGGIEIKEGEQVTGVRVVLSYGSASIRGVVVTENGPLPEGTRVSLTLGKPGEGVGTHPFAVDQRGRFLIEGITAGTYELTTLVSITAPSRRAQVFKQIVTVQEGLSQEVTIKVDLSADPPARP